MLHYQAINKDAKKEWVILLHGLGGNSTIWNKQVDKLAEYANVLLIDFYGHGQTKEVKEEYSFEELADDIIGIMNKLKIKSAHLAGISLGTILAHMIAYRYPQRVKSMVLGGAVLDLDLRTKFLLKLGNILKSIFPYMLLYRFFALIIMPRRNHAHSRKVFVREAKKLGQKEFVKWYHLILKFPELSQKLKTGIQGKIPKLYISGSQDKLFLKQVEEFTAIDQRSEMHVIHKCGHVCNIEKYKEFNGICLNYLFGVPMFRQHRYAVESPSLPARPKVQGLAFNLKYSSIKGS